MLRYHFVSQVLSRDFCLGPIAGSLEMKDTVLASPRDKSPLVPFWERKAVVGQESRSASSHCSFLFLATSLWGLFAQRMSWEG